MNSTIGPIQHEESLPATLEALPNSPPDRTGWPWTEGSLKHHNAAALGDDTAWPKISVVTPSYNQGKFLEKAIRSVLLQGYPNLEYIIIDGGSTDESIEIIKKYDPWIDFWVSEMDRGQSHAINKGFERATGDLFAWLNSDDYYLAGALTAVARSWREYQFPGAIVGKARKITTSGKEIYTSEASNPSLETFLRWRNGGNFLQPACFFSKQAWEQCGPLREDLVYSMDVALWLEMVKQYNFVATSSMLAHAVSHDRAKTTAEAERTAVEVSLLIAEYGGHDIARANLMKMADRLADLRGKVRKIKKNPLYRLLGPIYHWLR